MSNTTTPHRKARRVSVPRGEAFERVTPWASLLSGLVLWEVVGRSLELRFLPPFTEVMARLLDLIGSGAVVGDLIRSLGNLVLGFGLALLVGVSVGVAMARLRWLEDMLDPFVYALLTAPTVVFVPIYFSIFGLSRWAIVFLVFQYGVFIIIVNTITAVKTVDGELIEMARVFGSPSGYVTVRKVIIPAALPLISAGVRLGMGRCVKGMINGEILIALVGLGGLSAQFGRAYDAAGVLAVLLLVIAVAVLADELVRLVDQRVNAWLPSTQRS